MWGGDILASDAFAPEPEHKRRRFPWRNLGIAVVAAAGVLVWRSWPKVPFSSVIWPGVKKGSAISSTPPAANEPVEATPARAATPPAQPVIPHEAPPEPQPPPASAAAPSAPIAVPVTKKSHSKSSSKHKRKRHHKSSRSRS
jgi:hypothetical protein